MGKLRMERLLTKPVRVNWAELADANALSYEVYLNGEFYKSLSSNHTSCIIDDLVVGSENNIAVYGQYPGGEKRLLPGAVDSIWAFHTPDGLPVDICVFTVIPEFECKKRPHMPIFKTYILLIRRKDETYGGGWALPGDFLRWMKL